MAGIKWHDADCRQSIEVRGTGSPFRVQTVSGPESTGNAFSAAYSRNRSRAGAGGRQFASYLFLFIFIPTLVLTGCATTQDIDVYHDPGMDFPAIRTLAILPFINLSSDPLAAARVRDVFANALLATEAFYVLPSGEVTRGVTRTGLANSADPSPDEVVRFSKLIGADAVITGVLREYGAVRSGTIKANTISLSLNMSESETGRIVWSASSTKGGVNTWIRLFGGGGKPMNQVTREAVEELLDSLFL